MKIELDDLCRTFGSLQALEGVTVDLPSGSVTAILGTNGAGKTTLLRLMAGLISPTRGEIRYDGERFTRARLDLRKRFMFVADAPLVLPDSPVVGWIGTCLRLYDVERPNVDGLVLRLLTDLDLGALAGMPLATLSRGQVYKTALAALVAVDPEVWLLDEPFASGMDPAGLRVLCESVVEAASRGRTVVFTTQVLELAEKVASRVLILDRGRLVAHGPLPELAAAGGLEGMFRHLREERG